MDFIDYTGDPRATLMHFNPNHDPRNGQFAKKSGGFGARKYQNPDGTLTASNRANDKQIFVSKKTDIDWGMNKETIKRGAIIVATLLTAYGAYKFVNSPTFSQYAKSGYNYIAKQMEPKVLSKLKKITRT